jgi:hypothetical protein
MIDELRLRAIAAAVDILVRSKLKDRVCAAVDAMVGLCVVDTLAAVLDDLNAPRYVPKCE